LRLRGYRKCEQTDSTEFRKKFASGWHFHANLRLAPHDGPIPAGGLGGNLNRDFRDKSVFTDECGPATGQRRSTMQMPLDRNVQFRNTLRLFF
jgi:hypothetical protein